MASQVLNFSAEIDNWTQETVQRITAVFHEATQRVVAKTQERIPIDTGFARASIRASLDDMPPLVEKAHGGPKESYPPDLSQVTTTIATAKLGQTIFVGYTAGYAIFLEYGHSTQAPSGFVGVSAQEWPAIVDQVVSEAKTRGRL